MSTRDETTMNILQRLPAELQLNVFEFFGYQEAIRMSQVNRYFLKVVDPQQCIKADKESFIHEAEKWEKHNKVYYDNRFNNQYKDREFKILSDGYACFSCYRVLEKSAFSKNQTMRKNGKSNHRYRYIGHTRFCIDCGLRSDKYRSKTLIHSIQKEVFQVSMKGGSMLTTATLHLVVCPSCEEAAEFVLTDEQVVCPECNESEAFIRDYEEAATLMGRAGGISTIQCISCEHITTIKTNEKVLRCCRCDYSLCKRCLWPQSPDHICPRADIESQNEDNDLAEAPHGHEVLEQDEEDVLRVLGMEVYA